MADRTSKSSTTAIEPGVKTAAPPRVAIAVTVTDEAEIPTNCVDAEPYALRVIGNDLAPDLPDESIIIIDPGITPCAGQYVIADLGAGVTLGALAGQSSHWRLHPRGTEHDGIALQLRQIRGVVVQRAGRRRRDHRRF
jgi:DNA polymerase V